MTDKPAVIHSAAYRTNAYRTALLATASMIALFATISQIEARPFGNSATPSPSAAAIAAAQSAQLEAQRAARQAENALRRATLAIQAQQATQQAARDAARAQLSTIANGLRPGGLQVAPDAVPGSNLWQGAKLPTEFTDGERTKVTIEQLQQKSILTWQTFNVGKETDLTFDQKGNRDWIALNRVLDPSLAPSRILGSITADGSVYVINRNGIIFGGTSQINVGSLLASSLDIKGPNTNLVADRDQTFLNGLFASGTAIFQNRKLPDATGALIIPDAIEGNVVVEAGAVLRAASASGLDDGGRIMLFGPNVTNAGSILTADGQAVLAAGRTVTATIGADKQLQFTPGPAVPTNDPYYFNPNYAGEPAYTALNTGLISADRGGIVMRGTLVEQAGLLTSTTSINRPGTIALTADGRLTLRSGSSILLDADAMLDAEGKEVTAPAFNGGLTVALKGSSVDIQSDTFLRAPSGKITIDATNAASDFDAHRNIPDDNGRVFLASGSVIDVSGLTDIEVPIERAIIKIQPRGQEFADSPLQRDSALRGQDIWVDTRISGVREDGVEWIGSPLLDAKGYVGLIQKSTREYLVAGGSVAVNGQRDIVVPQGAAVNLSGGFINYTGGTVPTTHLLGADGRVYNIADADPMMKYVAIYDGFTRHSARWGVTETWASRFKRSYSYEAGYYEGAAAGSLRLAGTGLYGVVYFDGNLIADIVNGERQIARSQPPKSGELAISTLSNIVISGEGQALPGGLGIDSPLATPDIGKPGLGLWSWLSADALSDIGLGSIKLTTPGGLIVTDDVELNVVPGGHIGLSGGLVRVDGKLKAPSGSIELRTPQHVDANIYLPPELETLTPNLPDGILAANTPAPGNLILDDPLVVPAGTPLPFGTTYQTTQVRPGEPIPVLIRLTTSSTNTALQPVLAADWTVPAGGTNLMRYFPPGSTTPVTNVQPGTVIPAGSRLYWGNLPAGYILPTDSFPTGITLQTPISIYAAAGQTAPIDVTFPASTYIPKGFVLPTAVAATPIVARLGTIQVSEGASLNTRGLWVDDRVHVSAYGAKFIDGGAITLATNASSAGLGVLIADNTGDIILDAGSVLDASSGGHILANGTWSAQNGVPRGKGGDISILTYAGPMYSLNSPPSPPPRASHATVRLDGTISSYGFSSGGALNLRVGELVIGPGEETAGRLVLSREFFRDNSFGSYALTSINDTTIVDGAVEAPAIIAPRQLNYVPTSAWVSPDVDPLASGAVTVGLLSDYRRQAVDIAINGNVYYNRPPSVNTIGGVQVADFGVADQLVLGAHTRILADAGARVRLSTAGHLIVAGEIRAHGGAIELVGPNTPKYIGFNPQPFYNERSAIWLASTAVLDASGSIVVDDLPPINGVFDRPRLGRVLDGGTVTISSAKGYVVGMEGARIDVSGITGELDVMRSSSDLLSGIKPFSRAGFAPVNSYTRQDVWSDGGTISFSAAEGFYFDGTLEAAGGGAQGRGGMLVYNPIQSPRVGQISLATLTSGAVSTLPDTVAVGTDLLFATYAQKFMIRADLIQQSGADTLVFNGAVAAGTRGALNVEDGVSLTLPGMIDLGFGALNLVPAPVAPGQLPSTNEPVTELSAQYVRLSGLDRRLLPSDMPAANNVRGTLSIAADTIDVDGNLIINNLKTLELRASGDIRLFGNAVQTSYEPDPGLFINYTEYQGALLTAGDVTFSAAQVYPGTGQKFVIRSVGADSAIRFVQNGNRPMVPLSAGGSLEIVAPYIVQGGTLRAPQGSIILGVEGLTRSVELLPGSLTSVSLEGAIIPYGMTQDQLNWVFGGLELSAPPDKLITLKGASVAMADGAILDLSAGGDLVAPEFIPGTGGSRDVLQRTIATYDANGNAIHTPQYTDNRQIYAIMPGYTGTRAPIDKTAGGVTNYGDVYLTGVPGLPDGYYTLLPAQYAVLPGAYRVVVRPDGDPRAGGVLPDGTVVAGGFFASSDHSRRDSGVTTFEVQSRDVWQQYSEYKLTNANEFFSNTEVLHTDFAPYRPQDAGRLAISAASHLVLQAQTLFGTVQHGRGGRVDIGGSALQILAQGQTAQSGYLGLFASSLTDLKAESILLGGTRMASGTGQLITAVANSILVSNDEASALVAPELLFAIKTDPSGIDPNAANGLRFEAGSVVIGEGAPQQLTRLITSGDGALVRVSGGALTAISNSNAPSSSSARVVIADGAQLIGKGSIALQSLGNVNLQPGAILTTDNLDVLTQSIALIGTGATVVPSSGFVLDAQSLAVLGGIENITLTSTTSIDAYGDVDIRLGRGSVHQTSLTLNAGSIVGHGGELKLEAGRVAFSNTLGGASDHSPASGGTFTVTADEIVFGAGDSRISGYASFDATASLRVLAEGRGSMDFGAMPVTMRTPLVTTAAGADHAWTSTGMIALLGGTGGAPVTHGLGGLLSVTGRAITIDTSIVMPSGGMTFAAKTGDLNLGENARLIAIGHSKQIFDKRVDTGAGAIALLAASGNIVSASGAVLDVSAAPLGGDAGAITLQAKGSVGLPGTLRGTAAAGFEGGRFTLQTGGVVALDPLVATLMSNGFRNTVDIRSGQGDLTLTGSLSASTVSLTADGGLVSVRGLIDASGTKGGRIDLYGRDGVSLTSSGRLRATGSDPEKRGGDIFIGTDGTGVITLTDGSTIDVSGGTLAGLSGGTLHLRAPIVNSNVNVTADSMIRGARSVVLEAFRVFDTTNSAFDGIIDPLGRYDAAGNALASGVNQTHIDFFNAELVSFVQNPGVDFGRFAQIANFRGRAGIELRNSDISRNGGDILVVSDWDLGAGTINPLTGQPNLTWRTGVEPGILTLRAAGSIDVSANLTDGFFNTSSTLVPHAADLMPASWGDSWSYRIVAGADFASVNPRAMRPLADFEPGSGLPSQGRGDVSISGHRTYVRGSTSYQLPNMIRTGTGFIEMAAGRDVTLRDDVAPGVIYTAGRPSADLPEANLVNVNGSLLPTNPSGFVKPTIPSNWSCTLPEGCGVSYIVNAPVWPEAAGDISIRAQRDVIGLQNVVDTGGMQSGVANAFIGQIWTPWLLRTGLAQSQQDLGIFNPNEPLHFNSGARLWDLGRARQTASWINFGSFNQGVMSIGGDVEIIAGRDVNQFSASLPTTVRVSGGLSPLDPATVAHITGGGDLLVRAGRDVLSGAYYVGKGEGQLQAGGSIRAGFSLGSRYQGLLPTPMQVSTVLGVADSAFTLSAGGGIDLGGVFSPTYVPTTLFWGSDETTYKSDFYEYTRNSGVTLVAAGGDIDLRSYAGFGNPMLFLSSGRTAPPGGTVRYAQSSFTDLGAVWPADLVAHATSGAINVMRTTPYAAASPGIELFPSPTGQLELIAERNVNLWAESTLGSALRMLDRNPYTLPSPRVPMITGGIPISIMRFNNSVVSYTGALDANLLPDYDFHVTHRDDSEPVRIYSHTGDVFDNLGQVTLTFAKSTRIRAGRNVVDVPLTAQNIRADDITSVIAGGDIYASLAGRLLYSQRTTNPRYLGGTATINVGGPGTIYVEAGRSIGPLMASTSDRIGGIVATGPGNNRFLPSDGADIFVVLGVANGKDPEAMVTRYLDPENAAETPYTYLAELGIYLNDLRRKRGEAETAFSPTEAVNALRALSENEQTAFLYDILFSELRASADPIKNPDNYGKYDRSYAAIHTLFPPEFGYPNTSGEATTANSGSLDLRGGSIQTQFGGDISILAPVGRIVVGSQSATLLSNDPSRTGILTLRGGHIRIMAEGDVLVNQSRIFTEQGGDILMWSSNGDLNAGKGAKTSASYPPLLRVTSLDGYTSIDPAGLVTGAGIGALRTVVGQPESTVYLIAPHGTVDLGDAGLRSTGAVNVAALRILNAANIQAMGPVTGIPTFQMPSSGGLIEAGNTSGAAVRDSAAPKSDAAEQPSVIIVEVIGFGGGDCEPESEEEECRRRPQGKQGYNPNSAVQYAGAGPMTDAQKKQLLAIGGTR
ncbi:filamentous haemagglutinin family protein [Hyphomicrobium sp. CS1BSMeth3]|uniref:filamentous haemagglutinin family protein n=1 Tax=Hyphomicrobium sp. CS1BSMeth3 TaxID=1892844 RepID=UPI000931CE56|nr:filamentous haemagglutinin family protein [Hyphomicrobium sp. CS1BSMeth3]